VFPGTGIGGGCVYEGRILRGRNRSCLEIGHVQVLPGGPLCGCGQRGCLEAVASRLAISAEVAKAAFRGQAPTVMDEAGMDLRDIRSRTLAAALADGNREVERIVRDAARWLGIGIAGAVNLLAPDVLLLGGGLVEALPKFYREAVVAAARENAMASLRKCFRVVVSALGDDAIIVGAAAWARDQGGV
jgi:glucokinase